MVIESSRRYSGGREVLRKGRTMQRSSSAPAMAGVGEQHILEFLILVDHLYPMLILLLGGLFPHVGEVTIDRHDGGRCRVSSTVWGTTLPALPVWRMHGSHNDDIARN